MLRYTGHQADGPPEATPREGRRAPLYPFQKEVHALISQGRSVILQAPTGAGKTRAALYPFFHAWEHNGDFPRKCIYSVPLRVLANQFLEEYRGREALWGFQRPLHLTVQTGERPEDPKLEGNLIFTTIDQTLSNFLNIPYALSLSQGNLNAGAVLSSYLVFDEVHLFDPESTLPTTLHLLRLLRGVVPFLMMTATLTSEIVQEWAKYLGAEVVVLAPEEAAAIPSQEKTRRIHTARAELCAQAVLERHERRSVVVCNTVARAQALFEELRRLAGPKVDVRLLHSRFLQKHRQATETWLRREFGKDRSAYSAESAILVATQVVEVGLDITSEALHTELAPAASIIQRAGRCARYQGEKGDVYVYPLPTDENGRPDYAPYLGIQKQVCERTWETLQERSGDIFDFAAELSVVEAAHGEADRKLLEDLQATRYYIADRIAQTIASQERGAARELIRTVDSRTVVVHPDPASIENPWAYEGFGIFRGSLFGAYETLETLAAQLDAGWSLMTAEPLSEEESSRERTVWKWRYIQSKEDLESAFIVAVNPLLARYSPESGFILGVPSEGNWQSPLREHGAKARMEVSYSRETYQEHVSRMLQVYTQPFYDKGEGVERPALQGEIAYAARRLEEQMQVETGTLDQAIRLAIALHDVGKMDRRWQKWAHEWQQRIGAPVEGDCMLAHTDYCPDDPRHKRAETEMSCSRPPHAAESAVAVHRILHQVLGMPKELTDPRLKLMKALFTAIARHHSAQVSRYGEFTLHQAAKATLAQVLADSGASQQAVQCLEPTRKSQPIDGFLVRPNSRDELLTYFLIARCLRLADQRSMAISNG
ncbi:MAG: CRISPR-associated helicase Cas3' [Anaerolineae bacterium]